MSKTAKEELKEKIALALQKIQDNVIPGAKGLDRTEVREHIVFWELGMLLKEFVDLESIPTDNIHDELEKNLEKLKRKSEVKETEKEKNLYLLGNTKIKLLNHQECRNLRLHGF